MSEGQKRQEELIEKVAEAIVTEDRVVDVQQGRKLYVSNLDPSVSNRKMEADLRQIFSKFGNIVSVAVKRNDKRDHAYAFVLYSKDQEATEAIDNLDNTYFGDTKIRVELQTGNRRARVKEGGEKSAVVCFRCNKSGHFARQCGEKVVRERGRQDRDRRVDRRRRSRSRKHTSRERKKRSSSSSDSSSESSERPRKGRTNHRRKKSSSSSSSSSSSK